MFGGDFRQLPTVIPYASKQQVVDASIKNSPLWKNFKVMTLRENMRIGDQNDNFPLVMYDDFLHRLGDGVMETNSEEQVTLPYHLCSPINTSDPTNSIKEAIQFVYGDISEQCQQATWPDLLKSRAILCPKNVNVDKINQACLNNLPTTLIILASDDKTMQPTDAINYPNEYINI